MWDLPIQISWHDENAGESYVEGNSVDVSNYGMGVELPTPVPLSTPVKLSIDGVDIIAIVRNVQEIPGGRFLIGLQFRRTLLGEPLPTIHQALLRSVTPPSKSPAQSVNFRSGRRVLKRLLNIRCLLMDHDFGWGRDADGNLTLDCTRCRSSVPVNFG